MLPCKDLARMRKKEAVGRVRVWGGLEPKCEAECCLFNVKV